MGFDTVKGESGKQSAVDMIDNMILTIDIGGTCLKMAEFVAGADGDTITLTNFAVKEMDYELAEEDFAAAFAEAFHQVIKENTFVARNVRVAISSLHAFQRLSKLPPLMGNRSRAAQVVESEAKLTVPYPLDEVLWDYQLIKYTKTFEVENEAAGDDGEPAEKITETVEELEALFVAIKEDLTNAICTTLLDADYEVLSVEVSPTAIYNAARANMMGEKSCDMILDLGGRGSNLIIVDGARVFMRAIPIGGHTITQQIAKEFSISYTDAEEMKRKHGFVALGGAYEDSDSEVAATISKIARNVMIRLHGEVNRSINAWRSMFGGNRPQTLYISGGSSIIPYVPHFFNEKLQLEVSFLNAFPVINISETVDKQALQGVAHIFPTLIGLGVRQLRTCPVEIALTPKVIRFASDLEKKKPYFYASAVCALLCLLVFYGGVSARTFYDQRLEEMASSQLSGAEEIAKSVKKQNQLLKTAEGHYESLNNVVASRTTWADLLNDLQEHTPSNMWFTEIEGIKDFVNTDQPVTHQNNMDPGMDPGMGEEMMDMPAAPAEEIQWLRLKGHSLVMNIDDPRGVEDYFREKLKQSKFFNMEEAANFKNPRLTVNAGKNNVTSFVIYLKLKNPIKQ